MSTHMLLLTMLLPLVGTAFAGLVIFALVSAFTSGNGTPLPTDPSQPLRLHARLSRPGASGGMLSSRFDPTLSGMIGLSGGVLYWEPDQGERWATPLSSVMVLRVRGAHSLSGEPHVEIEIAGSGLWRLVVSDRPINRIMGNDWKRFREARRAREFAGLMIRGGARDGAPFA